MNLSKNYFSPIVFIFTLVSTSCLSAVEPLYKYYLKMYDDLSTEKLEELRKFWKSDKFESKLSEDKVVDQLIEFADHLKNRYDSSQKIYALGQSPAYLVLTAALLEALSEKGNPDRYGFIAISSGSSLGNDRLDNKTIVINGELVFNTFEEFKNKLNAYASYLKNINFITSQKDTAVIAEQAEKGIGILLFEFVLEQIKNLNLLKKNEFIPSLKWYIHQSSSYDQLVENPTTLQWPETEYNIKYYKKYLVPKNKYSNDEQEEFEKNMRNPRKPHPFTAEEFKKLKPLYKITFNSKDEKESVISVIKEMPDFDFSRSLSNYTNYPSELNADKKEKLRLVASFKPQQWGTIDPQEFVPDKEADMLVLRIIDRIKQTIK